MVLPTYYTIQFRSLDDYGCSAYDFEAEFDTLEEAEKDFKQWIEDDEKMGVDDYVEMILFQCGNGEEPIELDSYEFEGIG